MKFNIIIGNPPYLKRQWLKWAKLMIEYTEDFWQLVHPGAAILVSANAESLSTHFGKKVIKLFKDNGCQFYSDVTKYFPVRSGNLIITFGNKNKKFNSSAFEPKSKEQKKLYNVFNHKTDIKSFCLRGTSSTNPVYAFKKYNSPQGEYIHPTIISVRKNGLTIKYMKFEDVKMSKKHKNELIGKFLLFNRFFGKNNPDPIYQIDDIEKYSFGYNVMAFKLYENETIGGFRSVYCSDLYRKLLKNIGCGGFDVNQTQMQALPRLDLSEIWTKEKLDKKLKTS